jgi:peptidoglycan hydrolase-like protein with peptidoglycan-binding domain
MSGYEVYRSTSAGGTFSNVSGDSWSTGSFVASKLVGTCSNGTCTWTDSGLTKGQTYFYKVAAFDGDGYNSTSSDASAGTEVPSDTGGAVLIGGGSSSSSNQPTPTSTVSATTTVTSTSSVTSPTTTCTTCGMAVKVTIKISLKVGDRGDDIKTLQTWLAQDKIIYPEGLITGYFGPATKRAVIKFQEKYTNDVLRPFGLKNGNGWVGPATRAKLNEVFGNLATTTTSFATTTNISVQKVMLKISLKVGDRGDDIKTLQTWLAQDKIIYPEGLITGYFGPATKRAVIKFQEKYTNDVLRPFGLKNGNGWVGPATRAKLNEVFGE